MQPTKRESMAFQGMIMGPNVFVAIQNATKQCGISKIYIQIDMPILISQVCQNPNFRTPS